MNASPAEPPATRALDEHTMAEGLTAECQGAVDE